MLRAVFKSYFHVPLSDWSLLDIYKEKWPMKIAKKNMSFRIHEVFFKKFKQKLKIIISMKVSCVTLKNI